MADESDPPPTPASSLIPSEDPTADAIPSAPPPAPAKPTRDHTAIARLKTLQNSLLRHVLIQLRTTDATVVRFSKLLSRPGGLSAFLSTLNYTIYLLAYLTRGLPAARSGILEPLTRLLGLRSRTLASSTTTTTPPSVSSTAFPSTSSLTPTTTPPAPDLSTRLTRLGSTLSETRSTLRLFSLAPLYAWTRSLVLTSSRSADAVTHSIALLQACSYVLFQGLENVALLSDKRVVQLRNGRGSAAYWRWSARLWAFGVFLDFARLARLAQMYRQEDLQQQQEEQAPGLKTVESKDVAAVRAESRKARDQQWRNELWTAGCWFPLCVHWSLEGGLKGMNGGLIGLLGLLAELRTFRRVWAETLN